MLMVVVAGCRDQQRYSELEPQAERVALEFVKALVDREFFTAYRLASSELRESMGVQDLRDGFEAVVPPDWGPAGPLEIGRTMHDWADRRLGDIVWVYVSIPGDVYSEAVTFVVTLEDEKLLVRSLEFGRP
jgi:hypothetical protein